MSDVREQMTEDRGQNIDEVIGYWLFVIRIKKQSTEMSHL
jgi:hypothetical protein